MTAIPVAITVAEVEHLERLHRLEGHYPEVDLDARWGLTVAGLRAIEAVTADDLPHGFRGDAVRWLPFKNQHGGRWLVDLR